MTEIDFEKIRDAQRKEREESTLSKIDEDLYPSIATYVQAAKKQYKENPNTEKLREIENITKLSKDLFDKREQKILFRALRSVRGGKNKNENMTPEEKKLFNSLVKSLNEHRTMFNNSLQGKRDQTPKNLLNTNTHNLVLVRAVKEIPRFVGSDSKEYGPFEKNSVFKLSEKEAELLFKRKLVEKM